MPGSMLQKPGYVGEVEILCEGHAHSPAPASDPDMPTLPAQDFEQ